METKNKKAERKVAVVNSQLCIEQSGCKVWFTQAHVDRRIAEIEAELKLWSDYRKMLQENSGNG